MRETFRRALFWVGFKGFEDTTQQQSVAVIVVLSLACLYGSKRQYQDTRYVDLTFCLKP